ncbi:unnamed protein product [Pleuronectes platessa]|uniref:Uncharacterized protein n=1 Tax=Pleuronectes platessa TaxID=8262 RepID=A0A9N7VVV9_PLEPL|nr:unnamed protein product [Pleuronectes platessa]
MSRPWPKISPPQHTKAAALRQEHYDLWLPPATITHLGQPHPPPPLGRHTARRNLRNSPIVTLKVLCAREGKILQTLPFHMR